MQTPKDNNWTITLDKFNVGASPIAHLDSLTEIGNGGHYSTAQEIDIMVPKKLTQGKGLANLTNGTQAGAVTELINYILDVPPTTDVTYGIGTTKLFKITPTSVINSSPFPYTITGCTGGESVIAFQGNLYYFYNKTGGGDIGKYNLDATFDDDWGSTVPTGASAILNAKHPVAIKEDIMVYGNGRYLGVYFSSSNTIVNTQLDFGTNTEVVDVAFYSNQWLIAVNQGVNSQTNRSSASLYLWDAGAQTSVLSDEVSIGIQEIGFIKIFNGVIYLCYRDVGGNNIIGYVSGKSIVPLSYFTGDLPNYRQKTIYNGFLQFISSGKIYVVGSATPDFPVSISPIASTGYATAGGIAVPFGTPMVASNATTNFRLAVFSGYSIASTWKSIIFPVSALNADGYIDRITVNTNSLGANAKCKLKIYGNQNTLTSSDMIIETTGKIRHSFSGNYIDLKNVQDFSIGLDWSNGNATNPCTIRNIIIKGHWVNKD